MIKKGKSAGNRVSNHKRSPVLDASKVWVGKISKKTKRKHRVTKIIDFFIQDPPWYLCTEYAGFKKIELKNIVLKR